MMNPATARNNLSCFDWSSAYEAAWRFIVGFTLLAQGSLSAQLTETEQNPFPLDSLVFPSSPRGGHSCGCYSDKWLTQDEAETAIKETFTSAGIPLTERVAYAKPGVSGVLVGYNAEEEIGFMMLNRWNTDGTTQRQYGSAHPTDTAKTADHNWNPGFVEAVRWQRRQLKAYRDGESRDATINMTDRSLGNRLHYSLYTLRKLDLTPVELHESLAEAAYAELEPSPFQDKVLAQLRSAIDERFEDPAERLTLYAALYEFIRVNPAGQAGRRYLAALRKISWESDDASFADLLVRLANFALGRNQL